MGDDNEPPKNPFIRWKQHVDTHIGTTLNGLLGIPTMVSKNLNIRGDSDKGADSSPANGAQSASSSSNVPAASSTSNSASTSNTASSTSVSSSSSSSDSYPSHPSNSPHHPSDNDDSLDGVDAAQLLEWHKFIYYSPYSPLKLQQQQQLHLLPPPVPQDVPFGADPFAFTYADAFEDLLRSSSGRPLLDLADRSYRNLRYQMRYGSAMEPPYVFFHRMHSQRLLDAYFPRSAALVAGNNNRSVEESSSAATTPSDDVVRAVAALAERDRDLWREQMEEEEADKNYENENDNEGGSAKWDDVVDESKSVARHYYNSWGQAQDQNQNDETSNVPGPQGSGFGRGLFDELDRVFRVIDRIVYEDTNGSTDGSKDSSEKDSKDADAEDELYNTVRSAYSNAEKSLGTLIKSFSGAFDAEGRYSRSSSSSSSSSSSTTETSVVHSDRDDGRPGETIQTTEEHVDAFGNRHVKIVTQRLDADGNEVSRETRYTIRSQSPQEAAALKDTYDDNEGENNHDGDNEDTRVVEKNGSTAKPASNDASKNSGWFWK